MYDWMQSQIWDICIYVTPSKDVVKEEAECKNQIKWCWVSNADIQLLQSIVLLNS